MTASKGISPYPLPPSLSLSLSLYPPAPLSNTHKRMHKRARARTHTHTHVGRVDRHVSSLGTRDCSGEGGPGHWREAMRDTSEQRGEKQEERVHRLARASKRGAPWERAREDYWHLVRQGAAARPARRLPVYVGMYVHYCDHARARRMCTCIYVENVY
jgi:hypothetical protein